MCLLIVCRAYVQIDPDVLERVRQIDLLSYLREFEPSNLVKVKGTSNVYCTAEHDSLKISNGKWYWWSMGFGGYAKTVSFTLWRVILATLAGKINIRLEAAPFMDMGVLPIKSRSRLNRRLRYIFFNKV